MKKKSPIPAINRPTHSRLSLLRSACDSTNCAIETTKLFAAFFLGTITLCGAPAQPQQYEVLHQFAPAPANPAAGLVQGSDGNFYGTTEKGGTANSGTVFKVDSSGVVTTLHSFTGSDGGHPIAGLIEASDGNLYGTTFSGGANDNGTVFKMNADGDVTTLHSFAESDGAHPYAELIQASDGNFYGTTWIGGAADSGTVFKMDASGTLTTLHSFAGSDGANPVAGLVQASDGKFYGTTLNGGAADQGTIFKMDSSGTVITVHSFVGGPVDGAIPYAGLIQARDGNLYGTTWSGGPGNNGTIFKVDSSGSVTTFHASAGTDGTSFFASLVESSDGNLYGTTYYGGGADDAVTGGNGTVFKIDASGILTTLHSFAGTDGSNPHARLTRGADGQLYGTTYLGGNAGNGTVFKMDSSGAVTTLHSFSGSGGATPYAALVGRGDGNFLGTTYFGGTAGKGTVFTLTPSGGVITLHSFAGSDGANPCAALVHGSDGNFYGTTYLGGATNNGAVFRIDSSGAVTTLHSFAGPPLDGAKPFAGLVQGSDGNFYGTTVYGGADDQGTVFKMDSSGAVTTLHSFPGLVYLGLPLDGQYPYAGLIQASDGKFYGTTYKGGVSNAGVIFSVDSSGSTTTLHSFAGSDGANSSAGLIQGNDGNFYGTTWSGGAANRGTVFKMDFSGAVTTLHSFTGSPFDGAYPFAGLVQGTDGSFYGMTQFVGSSNNGTVFKIDASAVVTTLHVFEGAAHPFGGLIQSSDGNFYGATSSDAKGIGTVFRIKIATPVQLVSAASRKIHGSVRTFDLRLPLTGNGAVECRSGGMDGNYTLVFTFANALTNVDGANVTSGTGSISSSNIDLDDPHDYIVNLSGVENAQTISVSLTNVTDSIGEFSASVPVSLRVLVGDTNGDGFVNSADISQTKSQSGQAVSASNFREDVTMDGNLNSADISLVKSKSGTGLP